MLRMNAIGQDQSEWGSSILLAPKKNGFLRFRIDYCKITPLPFKKPIPSFGEMNASTHLAKGVHLRPLMIFQVGVRSKSTKAFETKLRLHWLMDFIDLFVFRSSQERTKPVTGRNECDSIDSQVAAHSRLFWRYRYILQVGFWSSFSYSLSPPLIVLRPGVV